MFVIYVFFNEDIRLENTTIIALILPIFFLACFYAKNCGIKQNCGLAVDLTRD